MQRTSWIRSSLLAMVVGIALATPATAATPDAWITTKTKMALTTDGRTKARHISVETHAAVIMLRGKVSSAEEKTAADTTRITIDPPHVAIGDMLNSRR